MQDHKMAAAGDEQNLHENEKTERIERGQRVSLEYAFQVLDYLLMFTRAEMRERDRQVWIQRLSTVPVWKLKRLDEFTSPFINEVWKFFDDMRPLPTYYEAPPSLPAPKTSIAKECNEYVQRLMAFGKSKADQEAADKQELEFIAAMRKKYSHLTWMPGRSGNVVK